MDFPCQPNPWGISSNRLRSPSPVLSPDGHGFSPCQGQGLPLAQYDGGMPPSSSWKRSFRFPRWYRKHGRRDHIQFLYKSGSVIDPDTAAHPPLYLGRKWGQSSKLDFPHIKCDITAYWCISGSITRLLTRYSPFYRMGIHWWSQCTGIELNDRLLPLFWCYILYAPPVSLCQGDNRARPSWRGTIPYDVWSIPNYGAKIPWDAWQDRFPSIQFSFS